jgi:riboflavin synthase
MFTGIVAEIGTVESITRRGGSLAFSVLSPGLASELKPGDSVAVNGVCQTITAVKDRILKFDSVPETLERTNLSLLSPGSPVNLEPALRLGDRLSGHLVSGHIDGTATVRARRSVGEHNIDFAIQVSDDLKRYIRQKGSICLDGVSLTVKATKGTMIEVTVIPYTLESTILGNWRVGTAVNLEVDQVARYLVPDTG